MKKVYSFALLAALFACNNDDSVTATEPINQQTKHSTFRGQAAEVLNDAFTTIDVRSNKSFSSISFMDEQNGVIFGNESEGMITNDGGTTWTRLNSPPNLLYSSAFMYDANHVFAAMDDLYQANSRNEMVKISTIPGTGVTGMHFTSASEGYITKGGRVLKTTDSGINWTTVLGQDGNPTYIKRMLVTTSEGIYHWFFAYGGSTRDGGSGGVFYRSFDYGQTWQESDIRMGEIMGASFINEDPKKGYVVDFNNIVYKTTDAGETWTQIGTINSRTRAPMTSLLYISDQQIFATGSDGNIYKSSNGGANWAIHAEYRSPLNQIYRIGRSLYVIGTNGLVLKN